jgi:hypothetical protein
MKKQFTFYGILGFLIIGILSISCNPQPTPTTSYELIQEKEPSLSFEEYENLTRNVITPVYNTSHLLEFLSIYGLCDISVTPAFGNYYQDIGQGGSFLGNLSKLGEDRFFSSDNIMLIDTTGYEFHWFVDGIPGAIYNFSNPEISDIYECNGVFLLGLQVTTPIGSKYFREEFAYFDNPNIPNNNCICEGCPGPFEVFYEFYPDLPPYSFRYIQTQYDFNNDNCINASDLIMFLQNFGE